MAKSGTCTRPGKSRLKNWSGDDEPNSSTEAHADGHSFEFCGINGARPRKKDDGGDGLAGTRTDSSPLVIANQQCVKKGAEDRMINDSQMILSLIHISEPTRLLSI